MLMRTSLFSLPLLLCLVTSGPAIAANWTEIFNAISGDSEARVEMKTQSFQERLIPGEKIISAHLWMFYRKPEITVQASGDYEIYCAARRVFRSNLIMQTEDANQTQSTINVPNRTLLQGKDYQDFTGIMNILCTR